MKYGSEDLWASLVGYMHTIQEAARSESIETTFINFDTHANIEKLPSENLLGLAEFSFENMGQGTYQVAAAVGFSILDDDEQFEHRKLTRIVSDLIQPEMSIPVLKAATGMKIGNITIEAPTSLLPMANSDVRALQFFVFSGTAHAGAEFP